MSDLSKFSATTRAVRAAIATDREHGAVVPPIHLSSTFAFEGFGKPRTYDYTRSGNPTRSQLADALSALEGGADAVVTSTGMSAVTLCLQLLKPGDTIVAAHDCYGGTQRLLKGLAKRGLFHVVFADLTGVAEDDIQGDGFITRSEAGVIPRSEAGVIPRSEAGVIPRSEAGVIPRSEATRDLQLTIARLKPRMLWVETPSNPLLRITDIRAVAAAGHGVGAIVVVDNTFLSPALQQPIALGADLVVHSTTKYLNGHSDVVGGAVIAADPAQAEELKWWANCLGITGAPFDSYLTLRGIRTLHSRIRDHLAATEAVVHALSGHSAVKKVYYPGLLDHPGHELAKAQQQGFGAMVSFEVEGGTQAVEVLTANLNLFTLAESLGGVESLIAHPATMTHSSMDAESRAAAGISDSLVRLSVGIESPEDLANDLTRALDAVLKSIVRHSERSARHSERSARHSERSEESARAEVVLLGVGAIGRELLSQLNQTVNALRVVGLVDRSGFVFDEHGLSGERLAVISSLKAEGTPLASQIGGRKADAIQSLHEISRHRLSRPILVDATPADTSLVLQLALARGFDLVLANKVPLAGDQSAVDYLHELAARAGRTILHEATVGAGLPVLDTLRKLIEAGDKVLSIEGCPSGTLGFLFGELGRGEKFSDALERAIALGYTEPDPRVDLSGLDVARKALILARAIGFRGELENVQVETLVPAHLTDGPPEEFLSRTADLDRPWAERVNEARKKGRVLRYRAHVTPEAITVGLIAVKLTDPLGVLHGTDNQFTFTTSRYLARPLVITGPGAGPSVTAAGVFNDLLRLERSRERDVSTVAAAHGGDNRLDKGSTARSVRAGAFTV